jgi:hypothetical protein
VSTAGVMVGVGGPVSAMLITWGTETGAGLVAGCLGASLADAADVDALAVPDDNDADADGPPVS